MKGMGGQRVGKARAVSSMGRQRVVGGWVTDLTLDFWGRFFHS